MKLTALLTLFILGNTCTAQTFISRSNAIADIDFYTKTLQEVHYNPFLFIKKEKYYLTSTTVPCCFVACFLLSRYVTAHR